jgi:hypothetical protein
MEYVGVNWSFMIQVCIYVHQDNIPFKFGGLGLCCLTSLSTIFQLYRGGQFYWWRKPEYSVMFSPTSCKSHFAISGIRYLLIQLPYHYEHNYDDHHLKTSIFQLYRGGQFSWWRKPPRCSKWLTNFIMECCIECNSLWTGFELTTFSGDQHWLHR